MSIPRLTANAAYATPVRRAIVRPETPRLPMRHYTNLWLRADGGIEEREQMARRCRCLTRRIPPLRAAR
jgi:hypothetical protein